VATALESFDSNFIVDTCYNDLFVPGLGGAMYGQQVSVKNPGVAHAHTVYT
jgi:hypothetical protein